MSGLIWLYIIGGLFAAIGVWTVVRGIEKFILNVHDTFSDL